MKILYYNWVFYPNPLSGGRALICRYYAKYLARRGHLVTIYTSKFKKAPKVEFREGYYVYRISPQITHNRVLNLVKRPIALLIDKYWFNKAEKFFDIFHIHGPTYGIPLIKWRGWSSKNKPVFLTLHGFPRKAIRNILYDIEHADVVLTVSERIKKILSYLTQKEVLVLPNGVDLELFNPQKYPKKQKKEPTIIYVSGAIKYKGFFDLIKAIQILKQRGIKLNTILLGPKLKTVKHENMPYYYSKADIFVLPSYREGLPMSLLEAMAMELAIVATKVGGIPNVVKNRVNGILVDPANPSQLADAIEELIRDDKLRKKLGKEARKTIEEKYNIVRIVEKLEKIYQQYSLS